MLERCETVCTSGTRECGKVYIASDGVVSLSLDGGMTWTQKGTSPVGGFFYDSNILAVDSLSDDTLFTAAGSGMARSTDGGATWQQEANLAPDRGISIYMQDASHGWICGASGNVYKFRP